MTRWKRSACSAKRSWVADVVVHAREALRACLGCRLERCVDLLQARDLQELQPDPEAPRRNLHALAMRPDRSRSAKDGHPRDAGFALLEQSEQFLVQFLDTATDPGDIAAGPGKACDQAGVDGIGHRYDDDGNRRRRFRRGADWHRTGHEKDIDLETNQFSRLLTEVVKATSPPLHERDVRAL